MSIPILGMVGVLFLLFDIAVSACGVNYTGSFGTIESPNYPNVYPNYQECRWTIETPPGTSIVLKFIDFRLEFDTGCDNDFVRVEDTLTKKWLYGSRQCGGLIPKSVRSSGNGVSIYFQSDYLYRYRGFKLQWKVSNILTMHTESLSWYDAHGACAEDGGSLVSDYIDENVIDLMKQNDISTVWHGQYYTPWVWLMGCYHFWAVDGFTDYVESKSNAMVECVNHCNTSNYFGLQGNKCYCLDTFGGTFVRSKDYCRMPCPGNRNEMCGGTDAFMVYMNNNCYTDSTQWQGTVSRTWSGKQCLLWADLSEVPSNWFPNGSVNNASNYCRDPASSAYLWCYTSQTTYEQCDIPRCIKTDKTDTFPCMAYKNPTYGEFQFIQQSCNEHEYAICASNESYFQWSHSRGTWFYANTHISGYFRGCKSLAGPRIFRLTDIRMDSFHWFGISRDISTESEIIPSRIPEKCFSLSTEKEHVHENVIDCDQRNAFICEHAPVTCGEHFNSSTNGTFETPHYNGGGYGAFLHCVWTIAVREDHFISLSIEGRMEKSYNCRSDFLKIYDEGSGHGEWFCDEILISYNSTGSTVIVTFRSDATMNNYKGALVSWIAVHVPTTTHVPITETTSMPTTQTTSVSDLPTNTNTYSDNEGISNNKLFEGGTLAGAIGVLAAVTLLFGIIAIVIRRRTHTDNSKQSSLKNSSNGIKGVTTSAANTPERNPGMNEDEQNLAHDAAMVDGVPRKEDTDYEDTVGGTVSLNTNHATYRTDSCEYAVVSAKQSAQIKSSKIGNVELQAKHEYVPPDTYDALNAMSESTENYYENKVENVYNHFNDSQEVYDHTAMLPRQQNTKDAAGLDLYDKLKEEEHVYNCSSTLQRQRNNQDMNETETYSHINNN